MSGILLDSVIVIDHLNGVGQAGEFLLRHHRQCHVSAVTVAEVLAGSNEQSVEEDRALLARFSFLGVERRDAELAAALRQQHRWKLPDALQAALAQRHGLKLATRNTRDFNPQKHPWVTVPYQLR